MKIKSQDSPRFKLLDCMVRKDLTTTDLAKLAGVSRPTISKATQGRSLSYASAKLIANALGKSMRSLEFKAQ